MAIIFSLAGAPLLKWADAPPKTIPARIAAIDGLRGFLALGVVFHHAAIYHQYLQTGIWALPPSRFYADLGQAGVAMFFMITGYLFWAQMLKAAGRPNLPKLYVGRVFRIVPLYLFLVVVMLLVVGGLTQWRLQEPPFTLLKRVAIWLAGGVSMGGEVNGYASVGLISAYVTWSLHYEWLFYASLLATSFFARKRALGALMPVAGLLIAAPLLQRHANDMSFAAMLMFCVGMTAASAKSAFPAKPLKAPQWALSAGVVGCIAVALSQFDGVYSDLPILILGAAFALVAYDATVFGVLLTRPAKRLGDISYGIYLLQGPVFFLIFSAPSVRAFAAKSPWGHWSVVMIAALALVMLATVTHTLIERPGIKLGQRIWARVAARPITI